MMNKVSIVIPTFNRSRYLVECINSCINQTQECEIIVCDHGSSDNTPEVIKQFGSRIKYIRREVDSGVHFCWLDAILHASEDLIHINFDDDWIEPSFIEKCAELFREDVGCVISDVAIVDEHTKTITGRFFGIKESTGIYPSHVIETFNLNNLTSPCAGIYRKEILLNNLFVGKMPFAVHSYHGVGPDILFTLMSSNEYPKFGYVAEDLARFRSHENSITIDASKDIKKSEQISAAYNSARQYYLLHKGLSRMSPLVFKIVKYLINIYAK